MMYVMYVMYICMYLVVREIAGNDFFTIWGKAFFEIVLNDFSNVFFSYWAFRFFSYWGSATLLRSTHQLDGLDWTQLESTPPGAEL